MNKKNLILALIAGAAFCTTFPYDVTLVSQIKYRDSVARIPIALTSLLKNDLTINHIKTPGFYTFDEVPQDIKQILQNPDKTPGNVALFLDDPWYDKHTPADAVPSESSLKIAYSLLESTAVHPQWVSILNGRFDAVVVADDFYRSVYEESGITIPVFVLPHGIYIENLLKEPIKEEAGSPYIFGNSAGFWSRKNQLALIDAFHEEFQEHENVRLRLHGRTGKAYLKKIKKRLKELNNKNIEIITKSFSSKEYKEFFTSLDCYTLVSKGEGFSITPREALALGIPSIISNNTAHKTICNTGLVYAVPSEIREPVNNPKIGGVGYQFNCTIEDVRKAMREVYTNHQSYIEKSQQGREWVKQYQWKNLKQKFLTLLKPQKVLLGEENKVEQGYLMTNSQKLYRKYRLLSEKS